MILTMIAISSAVAIYIILLFLSAKPAAPTVYMAVPGIIKINVPKVYLLSLISVVP